MCVITRQFIVWASLFFAMAAQAAPNAQLTPNGEAAVSVPAAASRAPGADDSGMKEITRGSRRFGIGYEARQGIGSGGHGRHDSRIERPERDNHGR